MMILMYMILRQIIIPITERKNVIAISVNGIGHKTPLTQSITQNVHLIEIALFNLA